MEPLMYDGMNYEDKLYLESLTKHPGYIVLKKLLDDACRQANVAVIKTKPEDPKYKELLEIRHVVSYATNDVCSNILKSVKMHADSVELEERKRIAQEDTEAEPEVLTFGDKFGSIARKSPQGK